MYLKASSLYGNPPKLIHAYLCRSSYHTESSQYLEESFLPTNFFQKSLPRLPVPDLKKTLSRYLASQEAIQDKRFHDITKSVVEEFGRIRGPILQNKLLDFASRNPDSSYVSGFWYEMYLRNRSPIVLTNNPVVVFKQSRLGNAYNDVRQSPQIISRFCGCHFSFPLIKYFLADYSCCELDSQFNSFHGISSRPQIEAGHSAFYAADFQLKNVWAYHGPPPISICGLRGSHL